MGLLSRAASSFFALAAPGRGGRAGLLSAFCEVDVVVGVNSAMWSVDPDDPWDAFDEAYCPQLALIAFTQQQARGAVCTYVVVCKGRSHVGVLRG